MAILSPMKRIAIFLTLVMLFVVACSQDEHAMGGMDHSNMDDMPAMQISADELDLSTEKMSDDGLYHVAIAPESSPVQINQILTWDLTLKDADMQPIDAADITFGGGMPEHAHGFPTEPQIVAGDQPGQYLVEGVKMQMAGWWEMKFDIAAEAGNDSITFNIVLP